jgi:hypothetical protein
MSEEKEEHYYYFAVQDSDPVARSFGCVARSLELAHRKVKWARYQSVLLLEARPLEGVELSSVGRKRVEENPLVGPEWMPLVDLIAATMNLYKVDKTWLLDVARPENPLDKNDPYAQVIRQPNGNFHAEVGPTALLREQAPEKEQLLPLLGWSPPEHRDLPNYYLQFEPATSNEYIAGSLIQALTAVFGMTPEDGFFMFAAKDKKMEIPGIEEIHSDEHVTLTEPLFGLSGRHQITIDAVYRGAIAYYDALHGRS